MNPTRELRRIALSELPAVQAKALADGHATILPTHVMVKSGVIIGAVSIGAMVLALPWFHTRECKPRDSMFFIKAMEDFGARTIPREFPGLVCVPFVPHSPFHPYMARLGYASGGVVELGFKQLR